MKVFDGTGNERGTLMASTPTGGVLGLEDAAHDQKTRVTEGHAELLDKNMHVIWQEP